MEKDRWTGSEESSRKSTDPEKPTLKVGVINRVAVQKLLFSLVGTAILIAVFVSILAIWDYVGAAIAYKTVATLATLIAGGAAFSWSNDYFGSRPG